MAESLEREIEGLRALFRSERDPDGRAFVPLADAYRRNRDLDRALQLLAEGLERHPDFASAHVVSAWIHRDRGDRESAQLSWARVLDLDEENVEALRGLGTLLLESGRLEEARPYLEKARTLDPQAAQGPPPVTPPAPTEEVPAEEAEPDADWDDALVSAAAAAIANAHEAERHEAGTALEESDQGREEARAETEEARAETADRQVHPETAEGGVPETADAPEVPAAETSGRPRPGDGMEDADTLRFELQPPGAERAEAPAAGSPPEDVAGEAEEAEPPAEAPVASGAWEPADVALEEGAPEAALDEEAYESPAVAELLAAARLDARGLLEASDDTPTTRDAGGVEEHERWTEVSEGADARHDAAGSLEGTDQGDTPEEAGASEDTLVIAAGAEALLRTEEITQIWADRAEEDEGPGEDSTPLPATRTMAELFARQGLYARAVGIYEQLVEASPDDDDLVARLEELRAELLPRSPAAPVSSVHEADTEAIAEGWWSVEEEPGASPFGWTPDEPNVAEMERAGEPISSYFRRLLAWEPAPEGGGAGVGAEVEEAGVGTGVEPDVAAEMELEVLAGSALVEEQEVAEQAVEWTVLDTPAAPFAPDAPELDRPVVPIAVLAPDAAARPGGPDPSSAVPVASLAPDAVPIESLAPDAEPSHDDSPIRF